MKLPSILLTAMIGLTFASQVFSKDCNLYVEHYNSAIGYDKDEILQTEKLFMKKGYFLLLDRSHVQEGDFLINQLILHDSEDSGSIYHNDYEVMGSRNYTKSFHGFFLDGGLISNTSNSGYKIRNRVTLSKVLNYENSKKLMEIPLKYKFEGQFIASQNSFRAAITALASSLPKCKKALKL